MDRQLVRTSKFLSLVLRHKPETIDLVLDSQGWAVVEELLAKLEQHGQTMSMATLLRVVQENDKQRFAFNADETKIRANQGHSITVDLGLRPLAPPKILFHGTARRCLDSILELGLIKGQRQYVHLTANSATAVKIGQRHGSPVVLAIAAQAMHQAGYAFYCSDNQVWLTDQVPALYLELQPETE